MELSLRFRAAVRGELAIVFVCALLALALAGCASVKLISDYDEETDRGITAFQKKIEGQLVFLERHIGTDKAAYAANVGFYDEARVDLRALRVRAAALPQNTITTQQIDLLLDSLERLELLHQEGLAANDIPPLREAFNTSCTAILKLELAKKRNRSVQE